MYEVTYDKSVLYRPGLSGYEVTSCECDIIVNEAGSLTVSIPPGHPLHGGITLYDTNKEVRLYDDGVEIFRAIPISCETDMNGIETVTCKGQLGILNNTVVRAYGTYKSENGEWPSWRVAPRQADAYFEWLLANHNNRANLRDRFTVVHNGLGQSELTRSSTVWPTVAQEMLDKVLTPLGAYLMAGSAADGSRTLEVRYEGEYSTQPIEFGSNMLDYAQMRDYSDVATCIVPTGTKEDGTTFDLNGWTPEGLPPGIAFYQDRVYDEVEMLRYGVIERHVSYEAESQTALAQMAANQIESSLLSPIESISISAVDLSKVGRHGDRLMAGKSVHIVSRPHGVDQWMMCTETRLDILDPSRDQYTLGAVTMSYTSIASTDARAAVRDASGMSPAVSSAIASKSTVEVSQGLTSGVAVGTVTVNGTPTVLYAPQGGGTTQTVGKTLWYGGATSNQTVTLSETISNFDEIEFTFTDGARTWTQHVCNSKGSSITTSLSGSFRSGVTDYTSASFSMYSCLIHVTVNGASMKVNSTGRMWTRDGGTSLADMPNDPAIKVTKVVGLSTVDIS